MEILWQIQILQPKPTVAAAGTAAVITDDFDPILKNLTVSFNGTAWTEGVDYTYDETTGSFATIAGNVTVPAAGYCPESGHRHLDHKSWHQHADRNRHSIKKQRFFGIVAF